MSATTAARKPLGVRVTPEQHRLISEAAALEQRSVSSFVLRAALNAARTENSKPRRTLGEINSMLSGLRAAVRAAVPDDQDIVADFLADRRVEAEHE